MISSNGRGRWLPGSACRKVDSPEVFRRFRELDSDRPLSILQGTDIRDPAFLLLACAPIHDQNRLAGLDLCGQRQRSAVGAQGENARELVEGFPEHILPENMHGHRQDEPLASSRLPEWHDNRG